MKDFRTYLSERRIELERDIEGTRQHLTYLEMELDNIKKAASVTGVTLFTGKDVEKTDLMTDILKKPQKIFEYTIKDAAVKILEDLPGGLTTSQIGEIMKDRFGLDYPRSSLSPQMSRLKTEKVVGRKEGCWVLLKYIEAPEMYSEKTDTGKGMRNPM